MHAYIFPGQGTQFPGMGKKLFEKSKLARKYFNRGNDILGFSITNIMFEGSDKDLKKTEIAQPAIFLNSFILEKHWVMISNLIWLPGILWVRYQLWL